jgi:hypothetical protein
MATPRKIGALKFAIISWISIYVARKFKIFLRAENYFSLI